jgi:hypothetical protein
MSTPPSQPVDMDWVARELAKAPTSLTEEQQRNLRRILLPNLQRRRSA